MILGTEYPIVEMSRNPPEGVSVGLGDDENIFKWEILLVGPPDTLYEGGFFKALLEFPLNFPNMPPKMTFVSEMWHPNGMLGVHIDSKRDELIFIAQSCSLPKRCRLHLNFTSTRGRSFESTRDSR